MINYILCLYIVVNIFIIALKNHKGIIVLQITDIEYVLGNKKESLEDLGKINPDWHIEKLKEKTGIHSRHTLSDKENEGIIDEYTEMTQLAFKQDVDIWHNKYRVDNPLLCDGDGPVHKLREWYNQFFVDREEVPETLKKRREYEA